MLLKKVIFLMLIVLSNLQEPNDDDRSKCNLVIAPLGYKPTDSNQAPEKFCNKSNPTGSDEYRCCYQSYRIISSMTSSCKLIKWKNKDEFNSEKQLLKDNNAKNITIDCGAKLIKQKAISAFFLFFLFLF